MITKVVKEIICETEKEEKDVLNKLEKDGYKWVCGEKPTSISYFRNRTLYGLQIWNNKTITYGYGGKYSKNITSTAKEFLGKGECIVIYRNGSKTIALDKTTGKKAVAKCSKEDTYDFMTGAKLAFDRLTEPYGKGLDDNGMESPEFKPHLEFKNKQYGNIGDKTPIKDAIGRELRVGDTVEIYDTGNNFNCIGERVVVYKEEEKTSFVFGIRASCEKNGTINDGWKIILKRKYEDIKNGEVVDGIKYVKER